MDEVYLKTDDFAMWVKDEFFKGRDLITLDDFYREFENLASELEGLRDEFENFKEYAHDVWEMREKGKYPFDEY